MFKEIKKIDLEGIYEIIPKEYKLNSSLKDLSEMKINENKEQRKVFYKLKIDKKKYIHLTYGYNLFEVFQKSKVAYKIFPDHICKPIFHLNYKECDLFGQEYFNGKPIDTFYEENGISNTGAKKVVSDIKNEFENLKEVSSTSSLLKEFDELINHISYAYEIDNRDMVIIKKDFRKLLEEYFRKKQKVYKRWSPGDLAARNILINKDYNFKIIDLEFSSCTHFYDEDWVRLFHFSSGNFKNIESIKPTSNYWYKLVWIYHFFKQIYLYSFVVNKKSSINHLRNDLITLFKKVNNVSNSESLILNSFFSYIDLKNDTFSHIESTLKNDLRKISSRYEIARRDIHYKINLINNLTNEKYLLQVNSDLLSQNIADLKLHNESLSQNITDLKIQNDTLSKDITDLNLQIGLLSSNNKDLESFSNDISSAYVKLLAEYNELDQQQQRVINENFQKDDKIMRLERSASWRMTSPLRFLRRFFWDQKFRSPNLVKETSYADWFSRYDSLSDRELKAQKAKSFTYKFKPLFSILLPVYKSNIKFLKEAIESVINQTYPNWELCIADDNSDSSELEMILDDYAKRDHRIKFILRETTGHISECLNSCFELSTGDYITFLDHDDIIRPHALFNATEIINNNNNAAFIYSDEDKITETGDRFAPFFKPEWSPDLLMSQNYICHMAFIEGGLYKDKGGFRKGFEGSQDWDLFLRITEDLNEKQIFHIPRILYHWRSHAGSTSKNSSCKEYAKDSSLCVLNESYKRREIKAEAVPLENGYFKCSYKSPHPSVSIIIPTHNGGHTLEKCLVSIIEKTVYDNYEIVVLDNRSNDKTTLNILDNFDKNYQEVRIIKDERPFNFSALNNLAVSKINTEVIVFLNDDTQILTADWLFELSVNAIRREIGAVGAKLLYPNNTIQHAGVILGVGGVAGHAFKNMPADHNGQFNRANIPHNVSAVTGACLAVQREKFHAVSGFDQENLSVAFNDVDLCLKLISEGFRNLYLPQVVLYHHESLTRGAENTETKKKRFQKEVDFMTKKWGKMLQNDRCFNPNFSLFSEQFELSEPPRI